MSEIIDFYRGKHIFITGGAGFVGKLLMEKLLRLCDVGHIYILLRDKKGVEAEHRLHTIFNVPVFDKLRQLKPHFLDQIRIVKGDVSLPGLGMTEDMRETLIQKVSIVFHGAATVNFEEPIRRATSVNVNGTKETILLCQRMKHLKAFIHVSTAFSNCCNDEIAEKFYEPPLKAQKLIDICNSMNDHDAYNATKKYLEGFPNTYIFTKCVAENMIKSLASSIPTCIVRPSIIISTKNEPIPGWINNYYGPAGYLAAIYSGHMRWGIGDSNATAEFVFADVVINSLIAAGYYTGSKQSETKLNIINVTSSADNQLTYGKFIKHTVEDFPGAKSLQMTLFRSSCIYSILTLFYNIIPALVVDIIMVLLCKQPKALQSALKLDRFVRALSYFASRKWRFSNENCTAMWKRLTPTDKILFDFDMSNIKWKECVLIKAYGVQKYLLKRQEPIKKTMTMKFLPPYSPMMNPVEKATADGEPLH